jgi:hypothetical protein
VSEPFQKEQSSNMQCQRPKHRIAGASTLLIRPAYPQISTDKADRSNKVILRINAVDSENRPAFPPIIASVELTTFMECSATIRVTGKSEAKQKHETSM